MSKIRYERPVIKKLETGMPNKFGTRTEYEPMTYIDGVAVKDLIKEYVDENEIIRPMDMVVKSVVNKSGLKVYIIQNIDRMISLEDIANAKTLTFDELLTEIESIVSSGTKIDIKYYIDEFVDPYHQEEIFNYFRKAESDSITDAHKELGEDEYTEEEIRLVRIKFMSELGN